jgi:hypothetical protein
MLRKSSFYYFELKPNELIIHNASRNISISPEEIAQIFVAENTENPHPSMGQTDYSPIFGGVGHGYGSPIIFAVRIPDEKSKHILTSISSSSFRIKDITFFPFNYANSKPEITEKLSTAVKNMHPSLFTKIADYASLKKLYAKLPQGT